MRYKDYSNLLNENQSDTETFGRFDPNHDSVEAQSLGSTRKPKLTLKMINRLKKIRSTKNFEMAKKEGLLGLMYGAAQEDDDV